MVQVTCVSLGPLFPCKFIGETVLVRVVQVKSNLILYARAQGYLLIFTRTTWTTVRKTPFHHIKDWEFVVRVTSIFTWTTWTNLDHR